MADFGRIGWVDQRGWRLSQRLLNRQNKPGSTRYCSKCLKLLVGARGFECAGGAQASLEGCFIRLWRTPTLIPMCQATYVLARTLKIFLLSWLFCNQETLQYGSQKNPSATDRFLSFLNHVL